nr:MAG TPA: hypothetical protein [Caudoviricetes sp.]
MLMAERPQPGTRVGGVPVRPIASLTQPPRRQVGWVP